MFQLFLIYIQNLIKMLGITGDIQEDFKKILEDLNFKKVDFIYYDTIGFCLSFLSKVLVSNYKENFEKKIKLWNSMIWLSKIIDLISFRFFGKSLLIIIEK